MGKRLRNYEDQYQEPSFKKAASVPGEISPTSTADASASAQREIPQRSGTSFGTELFCSWEAISFSKQQSELNEA
jgi:hypothetical protein